MKRKLIACIVLFVGLISGNSYGFQDSLEFDGFIRDCHKRILDRPTIDDIKSIEQHILPENERFPILYAELLRVYVTAGIYASSQETVQTFLEKNTDVWKGENLIYAELVVNSTLLRTVSKTTYSDLKTAQSVVEGLRNWRVEENLFTKLALRSALRSMVAFAANLAELDVAITGCYEILELDLPKPYDRDSFYEYYRLGSLNTRLKNFDAAREYFNLYIKTVDEPQNDIETDIVARSTHYLGIVALHEKGDTTYWIEKTKESIQVFTRIGSANAIPPLLNLAQYYLNKNDLELSRKYAVLAEQFISKPGTNPYLQACIWLHKSFEAEARGDVDSAIDLALRAKETDETRFIWKAVFPYLPELVAKNGDYQRAFNLTQEYDSVYRKMMSENTIRATENQRRIFEIQEKEAEKALIAEREEKTQKRFLFQRSILVALIVAFGLLALLTFWNFRVSKALKRSNEELSKNETKLLKTAEAAEQASKAKTEFLSVMSHEIRTPLNAIIGMTRELKLGAVSEEQKEQLNLMDFSSQHLLTLINDILDYNKLSNKEVVLETRKLSLLELMKDIKGMAVALKGSKPIEIEMIFDPELPQYIQTDSVRLQQILTNLMTNAVKFTPEGTVSFRCRKEGEMVTFEIQDSGIGISEEKQQIIFEAYKQASESTTRKFGGTGLGLSIVKQLTDLMGGEVDLYSVEGKGSRFSIRLPLVEAEVGSEENVTNSNVKQLQGKRFLVAEDNEINKAVIRNILTRWNVQFDIVSNGQEAVDSASQKTYDAILMDVQMPVMDGLSATKSIRNLDCDQVSKIPIIALTASGLPEEIEAMHAAGMDDHVLKPIDTERLIKVLLECLTPNTAA